MLGPVSISLPTLAVEVVIFLVMVWVMETFVFGPIRAAWTARDNLIQEGLEASSEGRDEVAHAREEVSRILADARAAAQTKLDEASAAGSRIRDDYVARATSEFRRLVDEARAEIAAEREKSAQALRRRIVDFALQAASTVTGQSYNRPEVRELAAAVVSREGFA